MTKCKLTILASIAVSDALGHTSITPGYKWTVPEVEMLVLFKDAPKPADGVFMDGTVSWQAAAVEAMQAWNSHLRDTQFKWVLNRPMCGRRGMSATTKWPSRSATGIWTTSSMLEHSELRFSTGKITDGWRWTSS